MATEDNTPSPVARRITMRRSRGGFGGGTSTRSESLRTSAEADEVDDAVEPEQIHNDIVRSARQRPAPARALPPPVQPTAQDAFDAGVEAGGGPGTPDPRQRMGQVAMTGDANYAKEYRLGLMHRMLMRKVPLDQIARDLGISLSTAQKDRIQLKARLRERARQLDINEIIGNQSELYDEVAGMALRVATNGDTPTAMRLAAMRTTLAAEADRTRFLNTAGVFDVLRYRRAEDGTDVSDVQMLMGRTDELLRMLIEGDSAAPPAAPSPRARARRGGFGTMTMDDANASSGDAENLEI